MSDSSDERVDRWYVGALLCCFGDVDANVELSLGHGVSA